MGKISVSRLVPRAACSRRTPRCWRYTCRSASKTTPDSPLPLAKMRLSHHFPARLPRQLASLVHDHVQPSWMAHLSVSTCIPSRATAAEQQRNSLTPPLPPLTAGIDLSCSRCLRFSCKFSKHTHVSARCEAQPQQPVIDHSSQSFQRGLTMHLQRPGRPARTCPHQIRVHFEANITHGAFSEFTFDPCPSRARFKCSAWWGRCDAFLRSQCQRSDETEDGDAIAWHPLQPLSRWLSRSGDTGGPYFVVRSCRPLREQRNTNLQSSLIHICPDSTVHMSNVRHLPFSSFLPFVATHQPATPRLCVTLSRYRACQIEVSASWLLLLGIRHTDVRGCQACSLFRSGERATYY